jgi:phage FluMu protein Com
MPIRFRCQYCNQLLGIARRKAGTKVECPTCHAQLQVPNTEAPTREQAAAPAAHPAAPLFEHSDFDDFLRPPAEEPPPPAPPPALPPPVPESPPAYDVDHLNQAGFLPTPAARSTPGIFLTPSQATLLTVAGIFLLAIAFGAGLLVGRYCF